MKKFALVPVLLAALLLVTALFPSPSNAEASTTGSEPSRTISVTGQGRLTVKPDTATITFGVSEVKPTPSEAYTALSASLNKIAPAIKSMGLKDEQIQTSMFNLNAEYNWTQDKGQQLVGYRSTTTLTITTQNLDQVAGLIQTAVEAGANQLNGVSFSVKDTDKLLEQALDMAVDDAKAKAERVASRLGAQVVRVMTINVMDNGTPMYVDRAMDEAKAMMAGAAPAPVFSGESSFSASVSVVFEIQ